jgi:RecA-family ATPase
MMGEWDTAYRDDPTAPKRAGDNAQRFEAREDGKGGLNGGELEGWQSHAITAATLQKKQFPPVRMVIPGYVPEGLSILAGKPKIGKSWMVLELCLGVAGPHSVLGDVQPMSGDVLYLALEDTPQRLQRRTRRLLGDKPWPQRLTLCTKWRRLNDGGVDDIGEWASSVSEPRLVVIDTLAGIRPERSRTDTTYEGDYQALLGVHNLANSRGFAALTLHHTRKMEAEDPFDTISGTLGLTGCADTLLVLMRSNKGTSLHVRGRDIEECEHAVQFERDACRWIIQGDAETVRRSETRNAILRVLEQAKPHAMGPKDIQAATDISIKAIEQRLYGMRKDGEIIQKDRGKYCVA